MTLQHPFQKLCIVPARTSHERILLAASGPSICLISIENGKLLSSWPAEEAGEASDLSEDEDQNGDSGQRPSKRRKVDPVPRGSLSREASEMSEASVEIVAERQKGERRRPKVIDLSLPSVSHLRATNDGRFVIVVTAEDKAVKVLEVKRSGRLCLLSSRVLPKRLCALDLTTDGKTILVADKFGDVYSLPLHQSPDWEPKAEMAEPDRTFSPSATELTVHTKRNLEALRQQRERMQTKKKKEGLLFDHKLLLGHVSLLTDLAVAEGMVWGRERPFILTADRDEHIRVSRGIPQTHVIETYCLGHSEFVTKLCLVPWSPELLIAGNGEPSLRMFEWQTGNQVQICPLSPLGSDMVSRTDRDSEKLAVSGIWPISLAMDSPLKSHSKGGGVLLVAYEGLPVLQTFYLDKSSRLQYLNSHVVPGNVLDVTQLSPDGTVLVALDTVHVPASMKMLSNTSETPALIALELVASEVGAAAQGAVSEPVAELVEWRDIDVPVTAVATKAYLCTIPDTAAAEKKKGKSYETLYSALGEFLYGLENLRKKRGAGTEDETNIDGEIEPPQDGTE